MSKISNVSLATEAEMGVGTPRNIGKGTEFFIDPTGGVFTLKAIKSDGTVIIFGSNEFDEGIIFRGQLTSDASPETATLTVLENNISDTVIFSRVSDGNYTLTFGTEKRAIPFPVNETQLPQNGTFAGVFIQDLAGTVLDAALVRYIRIDNTTIGIQTFFVGTPNQDGLLTEHSVVIVVVPQ